ncbi:MAG: hypothetical protein AAGI54_11160 [Planctomycetota bacterium]
MRRRAGSRLSGWAWLAFAASAAATPGGAWANEARAVAAAKGLLSQTVEVDRQGRFNLLLRALRHLRDPALAPMYESLTLRVEPALRVHGLLGLAELAPDGRVDLARVATIEEPTVQADLITAALDAEMIAPADYPTILGWDDLNDGVRLLLYARQMERGEAVSAETIAPMLDVPRLGRRGLAALLLTELGDDRGVQQLMALDASTARNRDAVRAMLLETAMRHDLGRARQWAYAVATEPEGRSSLSLLGLRAAIRLGEPRAVELWSRRFASAADNPAERVRLALILVQMAPYLPAEAFDPMVAADDPMVSQLGRVGRAIADGEATTADELVALVEIGHPVANQWAVGFAQQDDLDAATAALTLMAVIQSFESGADKRLMSRWLDQSVEATRALIEVAPGSAAGLLRPVLEHPATAVPMRQAILLGLVRSQRPEAASIIDGLEPPNDAVARGLWLLLKARGDDPLTPTELDDLATLVAGGADLDPSLRAQAAWTYLKRTGRADATLADLID